MKLVTLRSTQTLFDIALQIKGSADEVIEIIKEIGIDNLESDPTGLTIEFDPKNYIQRAYDARGISVSTKPKTYRNKTGGFLVNENGGYILQNNTYKIKL